MTQGYRLVTGHADAVVLRASAAHSAVAVGVVARGPRDGGGLLAGVDVRHDDPLEAAVEVSEDRGVGVVGNAGDGSDPERLGGADHVLDLVEVGGAVLAVDHHEVVAESAEDLNHVGERSG